MTSLIVSDNAEPCKREPVSKKLRFEIFKRDAFRCQYCGATPPSVVLEVDHIDPVALGGKTSEDNLITACMSCNRGKSATPLNNVPEALSERAARVAEAEDQITAYRAVLKEREARREEDVWEIIEILFQSDKTTHARYASVEKFLDRVPFEQLIEAAKITRARMSIYGQTRRLKYFCGVVWNMIDKAEA